MCGRYFIDDSLVGFEALIDELNRKKRPEEPGVSIKTGEICPTDVAPVIANSRALTQRPFLMRWGFAVPGRRAVINARSETALEKPMFRDAMLARRCLVPATHYFEWQMQGKNKVKHAMKADVPLIYMAGIYRFEPDGQPSFTILTREADSGIAHIHDRMPFLLSGEETKAWLSPRANVREILACAGNVVRICACHV